MEKSEEIERFLKDITGQDRREVIKSNMCIPPPIGCGGKATEFRDGLSRKEYTISGFCQKCQDKIFGVLERGMDT